MPFLLATSWTRPSPSQNQIRSYHPTMAWQHEMLSAPKSQRFLRFAIAMPIADPRNRERFPRQEKAMLHCDLRVRWKVASDLRFRAAIFEPKTPSFCGISGDLAQSTRKSLAIAIVRFWGAKMKCAPLKDPNVGPAN